MPRWLRYWYRRLTGHCIICGGPRQRHRVGMWQFPLAHACGRCNKRIQHGMNYGRGLQMMRDVHARR